MSVRYIRVCSEYYLTPGNRQDDIPPEGDERPAEVPRGLPWTGDVCWHPVLIFIHSGIYVLPSSLGSPPDVGVHVRNNESMFGVLPYTWQQAR